MSSRVVERGVLVYFMIPHLAQKCPHTDFEVGQIIEQDEVEKKEK